MYKMLNPKRKSDEESGESRATRRVEEVEVEGVKDENGVVLIPTAGELMEVGAWVQEVKNAVKDQIGEDLVDPKNPLGFVTENRDADSVIEAAYRFCSRQTGVDLVLVGTGSKEHLSKNVEAINGAALPIQILERIDAVFGDVSSVSGD